MTEQAVLRSDQRPSSMLFVATIWAISPGISQPDMTRGTQKTNMLRMLAVFNSEKDHTSHQIGTNQNPTHQRNPKEVIDRTMPPTEQPKVTCQDHQNRRNTTDDKP
jgi:hypothetical protein